MQELDTENNYQIKKLEKDIEYYKSRIEELETENKQTQEIIKDLLIVYKQYNQTDTYIRAERFLKE